MSIKLKHPNSFSAKVSIESLVVPATLETIHLFSPVILFISDDLPTFGLPITATFITAFCPSSGISSGKFFKTSSSKSPVPWPCTEETIIGSPNPKL